MKKHERQGAEPLPDGLSEKRGSKRFPIEREVQYKVKVGNGRGAPQSGIGKTVNMSSGGVLFAAPEALAPGKPIELSISWPAQLDSKRALKLVTRAWITRCEGTDVAVKIENHEFRIQSSGGLMPA